MNRLKLFNIFAAAAFILAACAQPTATPAAVNTSAPADTAAPADTVAPANTAAPEATTAPSGIPDVPRNRTVNLGWGIGTDIGVTNPWATGYTHQAGNAFLWEPLAYFAIYPNKQIPWLADSMEYNADFTQLTIKLNKDAAWNDGQPVTSKDVIFTFQSQMANDKLNYHAAFAKFVKDVTAPDDKTVIVNFNLAAPRFAYEVLTQKFDTGIPIVPEHILSKEADVNAFKGGLEMVHSGPYNLVAWDANQKIYDLRPDWWAIKAGRMALPEVKRIVFVNIPGNMDVTIQRIVNNEFDAILGVVSSVAAQTVKSNPKITTHSGSEPPYGYLDWWPNSLWLNTQLAPYSDPNVRKALSLAIDRDKLNEIVFEGANISTIYPFPLYPNLQKFVDSPAVKAEEAKYSPREFNLEKSAALMTAAGFTKNGDGLWEKDGATVDATIHGFESLHNDVAPVIVEMFRTAGFNGAIDFSSNAYQAMVDGAPGLYMFGHGASTVDPYEAFNLYHSQFSRDAGAPAPGGNFSRYKNPEFDALVDTMAPLPADDPKFQEAAAKAMGIYWRDTIDIPVMQFLHRIPYNQTYWTNWPTAANAAMGTNGAFWHHTGMLVITQLKPAQ